MDAAAPVGWGLADDDPCHVDTVFAIAKQIAYRPDWLVRYGRGILSWLATVRQRAAVRGPRA